MRRKLTHTNGRRARIRRSRGYRELEQTAAVFFPAIIVADSKNERSRKRWEAISPLVTPVSQMRTGFSRMFTDAAVRNTPAMRRPKGGSRFCYCVIT
jgi:hypothetical protein